MSIKTEVYRRISQGCDMCGQARPDRLTEIESEGISKLHVSKVYAQAKRRLKATGFLDVVEDWDKTVYTLDGESAVSERIYCMRFTNKQGGYIEIVGILLCKKGMSLDHGLFIGAE